jgi:hypothetical protein
MDIESNIATFMHDRGPGARYTSFDYCFNYFQSYRERDAIQQIAARENLQLSCLHLGFFLASWGMFRTSSVLPTRSLKQFVPVMELVARTPRRIWEIDAHCYSSDACNLLTATASQIKTSLQFPGNRWPTATLATKIMLGVFGNVPAFDTFVVGGLRGTGLTGLFGFNALRAIGHFYQTHQDVIERHRERTLDFDTGELTDRTYTRAKVIDMIFFIEGGGSRSRF